MLTKIRVIIRVMLTMIRVMPGRAGADEEEQESIESPHHCACCKRFLFEKHHNILSQRQNPSFEICGIVCCTRMRMPYGNSRAWHHHPVQPVQAM